jgi:lysyl-tRNA synthetase class 2
MNGPRQDQSKDVRDRKQALEVRATVLSSIRSFFEGHGFLEIDTPVRVRAPALEDHIDAEPAGDHYLRTSPELHMKRLLAAGYPRIYQMGPCFRRGESGLVHHPEYTMLEWYRAHADYGDILLDTRNLLNHIAREIHGDTLLTYNGHRVDLADSWETWTVADAFAAHAGWNPVEQYNPDRFDIDLVEKVEPAMPSDRPVVLIDYPAEAAALARRKEDNPRIAERWELYIGGLELANAYSELNDAAEQRARFEDCVRQRSERGAEIYPLDEAFLQALEQGMPPAGGIALGIDRLVMLMADANSLQDVTAFLE